MTHASADHPRDPGGAPPSAAAPPSRHSAWATGGRLFAAVLLLVDGVVAILAGAAAIARNHVYGRVSSYAYRFDLPSWGWVHLAIGVVLVAAGCGVLRRAVWARLLAVVMASLSIIANFLWLPYQPFWALVGIALGLYVVWALCSDHGVPHHRHDHGGAPPAASGRWGRT